MKSSPIALLFLFILINGCNLEEIPDEIVPGKVSALDCAGATVSGSLTFGQSASGVSVTLPYSGGNGEAYIEQTVASTGVTGLTALLSAGNFNTGSGSLLYEVTGTPSTAGTAVFALNIGGKACSLLLEVQLPSGIISELDCTQALVSDSVYVGQAVNGVFVDIPYTGGNGGSYSGQTVPSTGVTGLNLILPDSIFASGASTLRYTVTGTPSGAGTAVFGVSIAGKTCSISIPVVIPTGVIGSLDCMGAIFAGSLVSGVSVSNTTVTIPYTGGNGGTYGGLAVSSSAPGVLGLTATLGSGNFALGPGNLTFIISGVPSGSGTALFAFNIGGSMCTLTLAVSAGDIDMLNCNFATVSGVLTAGEAASGVSVTVPYTGGNGGTFNGQAVNSTGVTGLTATIGSGNFSTGIGSLNYSVTGTPSSAGTASFVLEVGGEVCNLLLITQLPVGTINSLNCGFATLTGTLTGGQAASGVIAKVPYTGGNGGTHSGQTVNSTGVTGLTATIEAGNFTIGSSRLNYEITGTPSASGIASFMLNIGGKMCSLALDVGVNVGLIGNVDCMSASLDGILVSGLAVNNMKVTIPYTGGNGGVYDGQAVSSSAPGVLGLTATLSSGSFSSGSGELIYYISGIPSGSGTAIFELNIGGMMCMLNLMVSAGEIGVLNCSASILSGRLMSDQTEIGKIVTIPYDGGNGGIHSGQVVSSTGVVGLTATLAAGNFNIGSGNLNYAIAGTPTMADTVNFTLNIGGETCILSLPVYNGTGCNAKVSAIETRNFMCYNLGVSNNSVDPFTPSWEINGGYWQWGINSQAATGPNGTGVAQANSGSIAGWNSIYASDGAWNDSIKTANDPCPPGFRVPTNAQWVGVFLNNPATDIGSDWLNSATNYGSGKKFGDNLFLISAGSRSKSNGTLDYRGSNGFYWSSTGNNTVLADYMYFGIGTGGTSSFHRTNGLPVRCISE